MIIFISGACLGLFLVRACNALPDSPAQNRLYRFNWKTRVSRKRRGFIRLAALAKRQGGEVVYKIAVVAPSPHPFALQ